MQAFRQFVRHLRTISEASLDGESRVLRLKWNEAGGAKLTNSRLTEVTSQPDHQHHHGVFPFVWLRDNCQCKECFHHQSMGRLFLMQNLDCKTSPIDVKIAAESDNVVLTWPDEHKSTFAADWLFNRNFNDAALSTKPASSNLPPRLWGSELQGSIPTMNYSQFIADNSVLYDWLKAMEEYGLALLNGAPKEPKQLHLIGHRVSFLRATNFGETFQVKTKTDASNVAFTSARLSLHTDLPYYNQTPGVQLLHCIGQAGIVDGGENEFVDGFKAAYDLKNDYPKEYHTLTTVPIDYFSIGTDYYSFNMHTKRHVIELSATGDVQKINYSDVTRDSRLGVPVDRVQDVYDALKAFNRTIYHSRNAIYTKLQEGDVVAFDNLRVLHGRLGYKVKDKDVRHLEGGYIEWDDMRSRRRTLQYAETEI